MKKSKLTTSQMQIIKQFYLQQSNKELAQAIGSTEKEIENFLKSENLKRNLYTKAKLRNSINHIDVIDEKEVPATDKKI